ncbi:hypothetical protein BU17DRAFT_37908 [Hysterangium stoloniferum]|nr:hypothetical protein BU17DRAFT_37908 [Hysterangium stoloniferum]
MSAGLLRARRSFFLPNLLIGAAIASFAVGVWAYSISAVKQDVFDDVDEQARALNAAKVETTSSVSVPSLPFPENSHPSISHTPKQPLPNQPRGLLVVSLGRSYPWLFEPMRQTLVWGAPPIDHIGRIQDRTEFSWKR